MLKMFIVQIDKTGLAVLLLYPNRQDLSRSPKIYLEYFIGFYFKKLLMATF